MFKYVQIFHTAFQNQAMQLFLWVCLQVRKGNIVRCSACLTTHKFWDALHLCLFVSL